MASIPLPHSSGSRAPARPGDSHGNPHREGSAEAAIGLAGIAAVEKPTPNDVDLYGNPMWGDLNRVDELAGAASALMGQSSAARPVVLIRGAPYTADEHANIRSFLVQPTLPQTQTDEN